MSILTCPNCGAQWDTLTTPPMAFFNSKTPNSSELLSPAEILAAEGEITFCPKCPRPALDAAMKRGDDRRGDEKD
jgi:hypothetical protein